MDMYLKSKQGQASTPVLEPHKEQSHEKSDTVEVSQSAFDRILVAVQPIEDMNSKLDNLIEDMGVLKKTVESQGIAVDSINKDLENQKRQTDQCKTKLDKFEKFLQLRNSCQC